MSSETPDLGKAEALLKLGDRIRYGSLLRLFAASLVVAGAWYVIEHRDTVMPALLANQLIAILGAAGIVLILLAHVVIWAIKRFDTQQAALQHMLEAQIADGKQDLIDYKAEISREMVAVKAAETRCQRALARMTQALKDHGIEPPPITGWGDVDAAR